MLLARTVPELIQCTVADRQFQLSTTGLLKLNFLTSNQISKSLFE